MTPRTYPIDYLAYSLYAHDCHRADEAPVRWLLLSDDIRASYLSKARSAYTRWAEDEQAARGRRGTP